MTKSTAKKIEIVQAYVVNPDSKGRYTELKEDHYAFSAYTLAALTVCNLMAFTRGGLHTKSKVKGDLKLFKKIVGDSAYRTWGPAKGRTTKDGAITKLGLNNVGDRLTGASRGYNTGLATVKEFISAMAKSGEVKVNKRTFALTHPIKESA